MNNQCLKIQQGSEFRKLYKVPKTLLELKSLLKLIFSQDFFDIDYKVGDCLLRISTNKDFQKCFSASQSSKSIKLVLSSSTPDTHTTSEPPNELIIETSSQNSPNKTDKSDICDKGKNLSTEFRIIHSDIVCAECKIVPIAGIRFRCITCPGLDICESCEEIMDHPHPFLKLKTPIECYNNHLKIVTAFNKAAEMPGLKDLLMKKVKDPNKKKFKLKVKHYLFKKLMSVVVGEELQFGWELLNKGTQVWPAGSKLVLKKGEFLCEDFVIPEKVEPGEGVIVKSVVRAPGEAKEILGVWEIDTGTKKFGKVTAQFKTVWNEKKGGVGCVGYELRKLSVFKNK